jgi:RHS repeat-associated protein
VKKTEGGQTVVYVNKYYEKNITTGDITTYYYLGSKLVAQRKIKSQPPSSTLSYILQDHLGSTSVTADATSGALISETKYFPFGISRPSNYTPPTNKLFTGQRLDSTGLYYYNARYYDATIGRFISPDTIVSNPSNPQTLNRYSYCFNNPLKYVDPSGNEVDIAGYNVAYIWADIAAFLATGQMLSAGTIAAMAMPEFGAYCALQYATPALTNYLESSNKVINIIRSEGTKYAQFKAGMGNNGSILINPNYTGDANLLTCFLGHEAFHGAIWMATGHNRGNFAANEGLAYGFESALADKLGINMNDYLTSKLGHINPFMPRDQLETHLEKAAKILNEINPYNYGNQNLWEFIVSIFKPYQSHPLDNWSNVDKSGDKTLTVAKTVWIH